jgi:hypothetical protein
VVSRPTVAAISAEPNAEIRRCAIESLGWEAFVAETGAALIGTAKYLLNSALIGQLRLGRVAELAPDQAQSDRG